MGVEPSIRGGGDGLECGAMSANDNNANPPKPVVSEPQPEPEIAPALKAARDAHMAGNLADALPVYEEYAAKDDPDAFNLLGIAAGQGGDLTAAEARFRRALAINPDHRGAGVNLAKLLGKLTRSAEAAAVWAPLYERGALDAEMRFEYAQHLGYAYRHDEAQVVLAALHQDEPQNPIYAEALLMASRYIADWSHYDRLTALVAAETGKRLAAGEVPLEKPMVSLFRTDNGALQRRIAEAHATAVRASVEPLPAKPVQKRDGPIRLGLFTPNFHDAAPTVQLMRGVLKNLDRKALRPCLYYWGGRDLPADTDEMVAETLNLEGLSFGQAAERVAADDVDILLDLKGWSGGHKQPSLARRLARLQISWLAYPGTVGGDWIDYALLDHHVLPDHARDEFSEKVIRLPVTYQARDDQQPIASATDVSRETLGLPEDQFVFTSFNISHKIEPGIFGAWMRILNQVPGSVLWLMTAYPAYEANIRAEAAKRAINQTRIIFAPHLPKEQHLARLAAADLALDTRICGGHTTTSDALWAGLPVLGLNGKAMASRVSASLLCATGQADLLCDDLEAYVARLSRWQARSARFWRPIGLSWPLRRTCHYLIPPPVHGMWSGHC